MSIKNALNGIADSILLEVQIGMTDVRVLILPDLATAATIKADQAVAKAETAVADLRNKLKRATDG